MSKFIITPVSGDRLADAMIVIVYYKDIKASTSFDVLASSSVTLWSKIPRTKDLKSLIFEMTTRGTLLTNSSPPRLSNGE